MITETIASDSRLLLALQEGVPLAKRPFAGVASDLGMTERDVLQQARVLLASGDARRLGAVFDVRRLGYTSTLCAAALREEEIRRVVPRLTPHPGITHCYLRTPAPDLSPKPRQDVDGRLLPNLWFTLCARHPRFANELRSIRAILSPAGLLHLPATRRFKIRAVFDPEQGKGAGTIPGCPLAKADGPEYGGAPLEVSEKEKRIIRILQGYLQPESRLFAHVARKAKCTEREVLAVLQRWHSIGVLRRVALIMHHRRLGFHGNGMCVWAVPPDAIAETGRRLALHPQITHCYQRDAHALFPYTLYAMLHSGTWEHTRTLFGEISRALGLPGGLVFCSIREFKKTSHRLFVEEANGRADA